MNLQEILSGNGMASGLSSIFGEDDPKKKKPYDFDAELKGAYKKPLKYDNNRTAKDVVLSAAQKGKIDPSFLLASAWQEGMNKAVLDPDGVSEAYTNASKKDASLQNYPIDGFWNYGVDTFGNNYDRLKKYLPEGFDQRFKFYDAKNEKNQSVKTAAFKTNEDALIAKSAFLNMEMDSLSEYAKEKGIKLDDKAKKYFTLASFNGGPGHARTMLNEYSKSSDKNKFIDEGLTSLKGVHKNISPRLGRMKLAEELLSEEQNSIPATNSPSSLITQ